MISISFYANAVDILVVVSIVGYIGIIVGVFTYFVDIALLMLSRKWVSVDIWVGIPSCCLAKHTLLNPFSIILNISLRYHVVKTEQCIIERKIIIGINDLYIVSAPNG